MTDVALREHLERLIHEADRRYEQRFAASEEALRASERSLREYKTTANEWRGMASDLATRMATRVEMDKLTEDVQELRRAKANLDGRLLMLAGGASTAAGLLVWALTRVFP